MMKIGIDVGGTNTDGVILYSDRRVISAVKVPTTEDVTSGIENALRKLISSIERPEEVDTVIVGTTHFLNAVVQRRGLSQVGMLRIGHPGSRSILPFAGWPNELIPPISGGVWSVSGGHEFDGRPFVDLDEDAIRSAIDQMRDGGVTSIAVSSIFSPVNSEHEIRAREIATDLFPEADITLSCDLGRIGLLERENVALLNAALIPLARRVTQAVEIAIRNNDIHAAVYFSQNDGTIARIEDVVRQPVCSFASGATNSMRGAALLSGLNDAIVADVGGTTTDIGLLRNGFPNEANSVVRIGGVPTLFRMPDVVSIGLGGGSLVLDGGGCVGPQSVAFQLIEKALIFGGDVLTASDVAVAAGRAKMGDKDHVKSLDRAILGRFAKTTAKMIGSTVDTVKVRAGDLPLVAVGGGAFLVPDQLHGISEVIRPKHADCANAVGAALSQVSGEVDSIYSDTDRNEALDDARRLAFERAVAAGAASDSLEIIDIEDVPLAYLPGNALRIRVKAVGRMLSTATVDTPSTSAKDLVL